MDVQRLLVRLGVDGNMRADAATLRRLHRAWRTHVPYENIDIQLGMPIRLDDEALLDKFGRRRRGGFCFEMNGALALLLRGVGFAVDIVEAGVLRAKRGEEMWGNHIALLVTADGERWLADAGIGDAFLEPLPLREGAHRQGELTYRLERVDRGAWRMHHHPAGTVASYDFRTEPRDLADFNEPCRELSTSPTSPFRRVLVAQHHRDDHEFALRSRIVTRSGPAGAQQRELTDIDEFAAVLAGTFGVPLADLGADGVASLWERAAAQYTAWQEMQARAGR